MNASTQLILYVLYFICGLAIWLLTPVLTDMGSGVSASLGTVFLVIAVALHQFVVSWRSKFEHDRQLDKLQTVVYNLRHDLERTRRQLNTVQNNQRSRGATSQEVIAELKILQTLLDQIVEREDDSPSISQHAAGAVGSALPNLKKASKKYFDPDIETPQEVSIEIAGEDQAETSSRIMDIIRNGLSENRVDLYLQSIVALPSKRRAHYECYSRVRDAEGKVLTPADFMPYAEEGGLVGTLDNLLLFRLIQLVRRLGSRHGDVRFFINFSTYSLNDPEFFPQFVEFMSSNREFSRRMIFEISQDDWNAIDGDVRDMLHSLGREGFTFSLDRVRNTELDARALADNYFRWVKVDSDVLFDDFNDGDVDVLKTSLRQQGISLIASHVEVDSEVKRLSDARIEFAQGYAFSHPKIATDLDDEL